MLFGLLVKSLTWQSLSTRGTWIKARECRNIGFLGISYIYFRLIGMPCETTIAICSLTMGGVLERHPTLRVCLAHGGGSFPYTMGRIEHVSVAFLLRDTMFGQTSALRIAKSRPCLIWTEFIATPLFMMKMLCCFWSKNSLVTA